MHVWMCVRVCVGVFVFIWVCAVGLHNMPCLFCSDLPDTADCQLNNVPVVENLNEEDVSTQSNHWLLDSGQVFLLWLLSIYT